MLVEKGDCPLVRINSSRRVIVATKIGMSDALKNMNLANIARGALEATIKLKKEGRKSIEVAVKE